MYITPYTGGNIMRKTLKRLHAGFLAMLLSIGVLIVGPTIDVQAKDQTVQVSGTKYTFGEKDSYDLENSSGSTAISSGTEYGTFSISGDIKEVADFNGFKAYDVNSGNIAFSYITKSTLKDASEDAWHLIDDKTKKVAGLELESNILSGTVILQSSFDGQKWVTDEYWTNLHGDKSEFVSDFFVTNDIQLMNGCYYRVIVAYKETRKTADGAFMKKAQYDTAKYAEVYSFYAISKEEKNRTNTSATVTPRKEFTNVVNTGKDNGFDIKQGKDLDKNDPHFGWKLGHFTVNGYTRETKETDGTIVFLKTVGDDTTLWFTLDQEDIFRLNNNDNLSISYDKNGYDKNYQVNQTNFKHGTLIVKYTDDEGNPHDPVIYTNFLEANTRTGADTKIQIYEEGEYEVALDYEIKNTPRKVGSVEVVPEYTNYKMTFKFSIRNGNTMVFPKDLKAPYSELKDGQMTEEGFSVDLAKSKYLTIDIKRETVTVNDDGTISLDVRNNTVGKDNKEYTQEGKYTITVKNLYSNGEPTPKVIYVGTDKYLRALSKNKLSVDKLNDKILAGFTVEDDGTLTAPPEPVVEETVEEEIVEEEIVEDTETETTTTEVTEEANVTPVVEQNNASEEPQVLETEEVVEEDSAESEALEEENKNTSHSAPLIVLVAVVAAGGGAYFATKKKNTTNASSSNEEGK